MWCSNSVSSVVFSAVTRSYYNCSAKATRPFERVFMPKRACLSTSESKRTSNLERRCVEVAIVGAPNAGKSELLNCMVKSKVAAVSRKRHTTREGILGVRNIGHVQLVFVDTPGYLTHSRYDALDRSLAVGASQSLWSADVTLLVIDAAKDLSKNKRVQNSIKDLITQSARSNGDLSIILNKVDLVEPKTKLLDISTKIIDLSMDCHINVLSELKKESENQVKEEKTINQKYRDRDLVDSIYMVSALKNDGVHDVLKMLVGKSKVRDWILADGHQTEMSPVERATEIIREKVFRTVHREIPHKVKISSRMFESYIRDGEKVLRIEHDLIVRTKSHARILKGKSGKALRIIHSSAQDELSRIFKCEVDLHLQIKLAKNQYLSTDTNTFDEDHNPYQ